jgi:hypothetical protein
MKTTSHQTSPPFRLRETPARRDSAASCILLSSLALTVTIASIALGRYQTQRSRHLAQDRPYLTNREKCGKGVLKGRRYFPGPRPDSP